jgi:uncharacterized protein (TIGR00730 family)
LRLYVRADKVEIGLEFQGLPGSAMEKNLRRICVFCGSSSGTDPLHVETARSAGAYLAGRGIGVVYGGGNIGLMAEVANSALHAGGEVIGIIPKALVERELAHDGVTELHVVESMHDRKALMAQLSDGFIALPGGLGTLEELFEALTWRQLEIHGKPCGLLNATGYFDQLLAFLDRTVAEGFLSPENRALLLTDERIENLVARLEGWSS